MSIVAQMRRGHSTLEHPFDAIRLRSFASTASVKEGVTTAIALIGDRLTASSIQDAEELAPGFGYIARDGLRTVAVARDLRGELHAVDAACTHLGCIIHHDPERGEWQCPCHGSRFSLDGEVISGPATHPLGKHEI
jgi:Rieske Fe-S protein